MVRPLNNNSTRVLSSRRALNNNNNMKREFVFPLIIGLILGALVMIFWQFNTRLNSMMNGVTQLDQATAQNTKTVGEIVSFINNATQGSNPAAAGTPAAPSAQ